MDDKRQSRLAPALIAAAVLLPVVLLVAYVAGYFWMSKKIEWWEQPNSEVAEDILYPTPGAVHQIDRSFNDQRTAKLFVPAAKAESLLMGVQVSVSWGWSTDH